MWGLHNADAAPHVQAKHAPLQHLNVDTAASVIPWLPPTPNGDCPRVSFPADWWYALPLETFRACQLALAEIRYRMLWPLQQGCCKDVQFFGSTLLAGLYCQSHAELSVAEQRIPDDHSVDAQVTLKPGASKSTMKSEPIPDGAGLSISKPDASVRPTQKETASASSHAAKLEPPSDHPTVAGRICDMQAVAQPTGKAGQLSRGKNSALF